MNVETRDLCTNKGKGLFATKPFQENEVIFEENPLVSVQFAWNHLYKYKACNHCLRPLETAEENARRLTGNPGLILPHPDCCITDKSTITSCPKCNVEYCSIECLTKADSEYHKILCLGNLERNGAHPLELLEEAWRNCHYPPETSNIMLIPRLFAKIIQAPEPGIVIHEMLQFCHRTTNEDEQLAHKLLGEKFKGQISNLSLLLRSAFEQYEIVQCFLTEELFKTLLALIGTNGQGVATSPISEWVKQTEKSNLSENLNHFIDELYKDMDTHTGPFLDNEGVALYTLQSKINHSCVPNAVVEFRNNNYRLSVVALRNIEADEEILISYLNECSLNRSRHSRRKELMENYLFHCECEKCIAECDQPDLTSEDEDEEMDD